MLDCDKTLIHIGYEFDENERSYIMVKKGVLNNCSWFKLQSENQSGSNVSDTSTVKIRIPLFERDIKPIIKLGDILVLDHIDDTDIQTLTDAKLLAKYENSIKVKSVTYNENSLPYSNHIRISG